MLKIIDRYIVGLYLGRLISVFAICMLIFVIQTLWLYIDELAGKGLDLFTIFKFLIYYSPKLIPLVLPLSVLLASLMTYGTLAENYEFAAMKSNGISLQRAMLALIILHFFLGIGTFYFSNYIIPYGELKSYNLRKNLAKLKPTIAITEGIFNDLGNMTIKVKNKSGINGQILDDIIIHEKTSDNKNRIVIKANSGELRTETTDAMLQMVLYDGYRYEEIVTKKVINKSRHPFAKVHFKEYIMNIDLSEFNNVDLDAENYTSTYRMQKVNQLVVSIDSLERDLNKQKSIFSENFNKTRGISQLEIIKKDTIQLNNKLKSSVFEFVSVEEGKKWKYSEVIRTSIPRLRSDITNLQSKKRTFFLFQKLINLHKINLYDKYTLIFASFLLFLIGASLGAIIRKGGIGLPLVISVVIFLVYHYIGLFSKNAAEDNSISPMLASWVSTIILAPFAIYLVNRASSDKGFINLDIVLLPIQKFYNKFLGSKSN
ncbi:MAG: permease [Flavobacteriaceae bacterium]|nr:permease [Flavobacteriaceae bacterium]|tara:strand:- start:2018 stop:3475 length:1458 start_codon:yes stop_codon:yes gene_type:complete